MKVFLSWKLATILLLLLAFSFTYRTDTSFEQDLGRHLKLGEIIVKTGQVPTTNLLSYTYPDFPFINHHWLFEVLIYSLSQLTGLVFLVWLKLLLLLITVLFTLRSAKFSWGFLPLGYLFLYLLQDRVELRPEIISFFFTALTLYLLESWTKKPTKRLFLLALIQLLWVNLHIYFVLGLALQTVYLLPLLLHRRWRRARLQLLVLLLSSLACLVNPNFIEGALYPLQVFNNYGYQIQENQTIFQLEQLGLSTPFYTRAKGVIMITGFVFLIALYFRKVSLVTGLITLMGLILGLLNVRSLPYLFLLSFPGLTWLLPGTHLRSAKLFFVIGITTSLFIISDAISYLNQSYYLSHDLLTQPRISLSERGRGALDFVNSNNLPSPIFNNFDIGSYIAYRGYSKYPVFVDGRPEAYPAEFFQSVYIPLQANPQRFKELSDQFKFKTIIFSHTDQTPWAKDFLRSIVVDPAWQTDYLDDFIIVLTRKDATPTGIKALNLANLKPQDFHYTQGPSYLYLGLFFLNINYQPQASAFINQAYTLNPQGQLARALLGQD